MRYQLAFGVLAPVETADPGGRHADEIGAPQGQHPHHLHEAKVVADTQSDLSRVPASRDGQPQVAGSKQCFSTSKRCSLR